MYMCITYNYNKKNIKNIFLLKTFIFFFLSEIILELRLILIEKELELLNGFASLNNDMTEK